MWDLSPDGNYLCTGMADLTTKVYSTETGDRLARLSKLRPDFYNSSQQIRFSPDGRFLATAVGKKIELFAVGDWQKLAELKGHTSKVHLLIMVPATSTLISAAGRFVKSWDLESATELFTLPAFKRMLGTLALSDDSAILATATEGGEVSLWKPVRWKTAAELRQARFGSLWFSNLAGQVVDRQLRTQRSTASVACCRWSDDQTINPPVVVALSFLRTDDCWQSQLPSRHG